MAAAEGAEFGRIAILGLGLIGGSLARALKKRGAVAEVAGWGHREASLQQGMQLGIIDRYSLDLGEAIRDADIVVIATPTLIAESLLQQLADVGCEALITDVASVKGNLLRAAQRIYGEAPPNLVLGHPIAGSEKSGVTAAKADLFVNHKVIITPTDTTAPIASEKIRRMWELTGAEVVSMPVEQHDAILASTSHLPHVLAYTLVDALAGASPHEGQGQYDIFRFAAGGFRDFTRIASSDPQMWHDISLANRDAILSSIDLFTAHLAQVRSAVEQQDGEALLQTFQRAKQARDHFAAMLASNTTKNLEP